MSLSSKIEFVKFLIKTHKKDLGDSGIRFLNYDINQKQKRVLICYLDFKYAQQAMEDNTLFSTNILEFFQIIHYFIKLNYCVDIVPCNQDEYLNMSYDVIFGLGIQYRKAVELNTKAIKILYYAENPYNISKTKETERIEYFKKRHGISGAVQRTGVFYQEYDDKLADYIICLGERSLFKNQNVFRLPATGFYNNDFGFSFEKKNKKKFLWLGSSGIIHKGLDILIDVFKRHNDWTLYICGAKKWEFKDLKLSLSDNIIDCGFVNIESEEFLQIVSECVYILLPSCSEGISTGILTGMRHGLVPVVMRDTGFNDYEDYVYMFSDYHEEVVEDTICKLLDENIEGLKDKAEKIYEFANGEFTLMKYDSKLTKILNSIL